jgi:Ni/Co efflux regulator RcnB
MKIGLSPKTFALLLCAALLAGTAVAQSQGKGKGQGQGQGQNKSQGKGHEKGQGKSDARHEQGAARAEHDRGDRRAARGQQSIARRRTVVFTRTDQSAVRDYYQRGSGLPPGLAKRGGDLPPGLRRQLQRNGTLPPGLQQRLEPLPAALEQRLAPLPAGDPRNIRCESDGSGRRYCWADTYGGVRLLRQQGNAACTEGSTWGYTTRGIWTSNGCRADFEVLPTTYYRGMIGPDVVVVENRTQRIIDVIRNVLR